MQEINWKGWFKMSKHYFLINKETETIEFYNSSSLFYKLLKSGDAHMDDLLGIDDFSKLLEELRYAGYLIFNSDKIHQPQSYTVEVSIKGKVESFDSIYAAIDHATKLWLSTAGFNYIKSTIVKNLMGKTKSAYGFSWVLKSKDLDLSSYKTKLFL